MGLHGIVALAKKKVRSVIVHFRHKSGLKDIKKQVAESSGKRLFYFGMPEHSNMGDLGQYYCILKWLKEQYPDYCIVECVSSVVLDSHSGFKRFFDKTVKPDDLLVIHSGYNTNDLSRVGNKLNLYLMSGYYNNTLIVLPQTVNFKEKRIMEASAKVFNARPNMVFMARDSVSYEISRCMMPDGIVILVPDIVTTLIGSRPVNLNRSGITLCHRHDGEQFYSDTDFGWIGKSLEDIDCSRIMDTTVNRTFTEIKKDLFGAMMEIIEQFEKSRIVITDRYHGMIYSLIANTPVIVVRTNDHKVVEGYNTLKEVYPERIWFAESKEEAVQICRNVMENHCYSQLDPYFLREIYAKLPQKISEELNK